MAEFNIFEHEYVPEHYLVDREEEKAILKQLNLTKDQLPRIKKTDAAIVALETITGEIEPGRIIKIVRRSRTAGVFVAYRVVVV
ncbi:MAG: DNA-directed RNA polymerase subunit H [Thermoplasmata archaeon]|nr:DNA-directed RNA polymerase subunit H [Thermoplasmata archaeon]